MSRLSDLTPSLFARVEPAQNPASWITAGVQSEWAPWVAWNIREDRWYSSETLLEVERVLSSKNPSLNGPVLLCECARALQKCRTMTATEQKTLPEQGFTHLPPSNFFRRFELDASSAWVSGSSSAELNPAELREGTKFKVHPSKRHPSKIWTWVTFGMGGAPLSCKPDDPVRFCGLPWISKETSLLRAEIPLDQLRTKGADFAIPTVFDGLDPTLSGCSPDWRARPAHEHDDEQPWGLARDILFGGAGWPEILVDIAKAGPMIIECLGKTTQDWSGRPYLSKGGPK